MEENNQMSLELEKMLDKIEVDIGCSNNLSSVISSEKEIDEYFSKIKSE